MAQHFDLPRQPADLWLGLSNTTAGSGPVIAFGTADDFGAR